MDAKDIFDFAEELKRDFSEQSTEDIRAKEAVLQMGLVNAKEQTKPIGAGHDPLVYKQKFWFLSAVPYLRVNSPKTEQDAHAEKLEIGLEGAWNLSQGAVDVWRSMVRDADWSGRGWSKLYHWPKAWGDFQQKDGEPDDDYLDRLEMLKAENFPLIWRPVQCENTWPVYDARGNLWRVVEIREMPSRSVRREYGEVLSGKFGEKEPVKVIEYADDEICKTIVIDKNASQIEPKQVREWEHGLGVNPYVHIEMEPTPPPNDRGLRWTGCSFDGRHARPTIDSILTDALINFRRGTRGGDDYFLDKDSEGLTPSDAASARKIDNTPDAQRFFWSSERHEQPRPNQTNDDGWRLLELLLAFSKEMDIRDVLLGSLKGDETGILYNTASQLAQRQFDPTIENFKRGAKNVGIRIFRAIKAFGKDFEGIKGAPVEIPIIYTSAKNGSFSISLKGKDVEGWESRIQPRLELALPVNENGQLTVYRLATEGDNPAMDVAQGRSRYLGIENTVQTEQNVTRDLIRKALVPKFVELVAQNGLQLMNKPEGSLGGLEATFAAFSPAEQAALLRLASQQGIQVEGPPAPSLMRGAANSNREGLPQSPTGARMNDGQAY